MKFESAPPPAKSPAERIKDYLNEKKEIHAFDIANIELNEDQLSSISELIDLHEKARHAIRNDGWGAEEHERYQELRKRIMAIPKEIGVERDAPKEVSETEKGMLVGFLNNQLMIIDLIDARYGK